MRPAAGGLIQRREGSSRKNTIARIGPEHLLHPRPGLLQVQALMPGRDASRRAPCCRQPATRRWHRAVHCWRRTPAAPGALPSPSACSGKQTGGRALDLQGQGIHGVASCGDLAAPRGSRRQRCPSPARVPGLAAARPDRADGTAAPGGGRRRTRRLELRLVVAGEQPVVAPPCGSTRGKAASDAGASKPLFGGTRMDTGSGTSGQRGQYRGRSRSQLRSKAFQARTGRRRRSRGVRTSAPAANDSGPR